MLVISERYEGTRKCWFDKNTTVLTVNSGILTDAVKAYGSIDALATSLAMDLVSDAPVNQLDSKLVN